MNGEEEGKKVFAIAHLPVGRSQEATCPLELIYDRQLSQGRFLYGGQPLRMSGCCEAIRRSEGDTESENRDIKEFSDREWIPCEQLASWLSYPPRCYDKTDDEFGYRDCQWYEEEGFTFDADTNKWRNCWRCREVFALYNTTRRTEAKIQLEFDLTKRTGTYVHHSCRETLD